ncbi:MAG: CBS domain-containing protein [Proteobacteria bacterium]|nr:CBS domain-containing protein [Pseudomonadota bacterium]
MFEFSDKNVGQVMTPRDQIFAVSLDLPTIRLVREIAARGFSRVPVYQKSLDNIRGVLNAKDLVRAATGQPLGRRIGEFLHEPLFVPRTTPVKRLFLTFKQKKVHMAIVVSEYGKVLGIVTMDDLLSQIFGVLRDERAALQSRPRGTPPVGIAHVPGDTGPIPRESREMIDESRPVPREVLDEVSGAVDEPEEASPSTGAGIATGVSPTAAPFTEEDSNEQRATPPLEGDEDPNAVVAPTPSDDHPPQVDVDLISRALGGVTDRQMAGLPSRTSTIPPFASAKDVKDGEADEPAMSKSGRRALIRGDES